MEAEAFCMSPLRKDSCAAAMDLSGSVVKSLDEVAARAAGMAAIMRAAALALRRNEILFFIGIA
jgi:hypothetical protein